MKTRLRKLPEGLDPKRLNSSKTTNRERLRMVTDIRAFYDYPEPPQPGEVLMPEVVDGALHLYLYDVVGYWCVEAKDFVAAMRGREYNAIKLFINSPGGDIYDASAIVSLLEREQQGGTQVVSYVDGLCASAATLIALAASEVLASRTSQWMIHRAWTIASGDTKDFSKMSKELAQVDEQMAGVYAERMGIEVKAALKLMDDETYYTAEEAVEAKLVDRLQD